MAKKARSAARRKRQRKIVDEYCSYIVEIRDWEVTYSHGLNFTIRKYHKKPMCQFYLKAIRASFSVRPAPEVRSLMLSQD
jgi:hypothetical protein